MSDLAFDSARLWTNKFASGRVAVQFCLPSARLRLVAALPAEILSEITLVLDGCSLANLDAISDVDNVARRVALQVILLERLVCNSIAAGAHASSGQTSKASGWSFR